AAWQWLGYSRKDKAKEALVNNFERELDYTSEFSTLKWKTPQGGRPSEFIHLTIDCFKAFCMMAGTEKGKEVRRYFLECERQLKEVLSDEPIMLKVLEHRLAARFEQRFIAIEQRLDRLETQINSRGKSKLASLPANKKYLYTSTRSIPQTSTESIPQWQLILNFLEQQRGQKFGAEELSQLLNIRFSSTRRVLLIAYRQGLIVRETNPKCNHQKKGVPEYFYYVPQ
ncbi:MAG TPA: hypothetical protein DEV81_07025, partial [Cyanobacteria bacterium UBA11049]|nr:hypothetical protein [Cyanobacteria bacterium UBA11049]